MAQRALLLFSTSLPQKVNFEILTTIILPLQAFTWHESRLLQKSVLVEMMATSGQT